MSCLDIETKLDEVITVDGLTVTNSMADSDPVGVYVRESSISATLTDPYNVVIRNFNSDSQSFVNAPIRVDSAGSKIQFDSLSFVNNTVTETSNAFFQFDNVVEVDIQNSEFTNNTGTVANDMYFSGFSDLITISKKLGL